MARAEILPPPEDLAPVSKHGFFGEGRTFAPPARHPDRLSRHRRRPPGVLPGSLHVAARLDRQLGHRRARSRERHRQPHIRSEGRRGFFAWRERLRREDPAREQDLKQVIRDKIAHYGVIKRKAPNVIAALEAWRDLALSKPQDEAIDKDALDAILRLRLDLHDEMQPHMSKFYRRGQGRGSLGRDPPAASAPRPRRRL